MRLHVLLVEDDQAKRSAVLAVLSEAGVDPDSVVQATDARSARRHLGDSRFDVMVLDIALPNDPVSGVSVDAGLELLKELLGDDRLLVPRQIIGISGVDEVVEEARAAFSSRGCLFVRYSSGESEWRVPMRSAVENARRSLIPGDEGFRSHAFIVCALADPELSAVLGNGWTWNRHVVHGDDTEYHRAQLSDGRLVFAASAYRMGTEASAVLASKAIDHFRPKFLAMSGISAGVSERTNYGDVLVADPVWNWGSGKWKIEKKKRVFAPDPHQMALDVTLRRVVQEIAEDASRLASIKRAWQAPAPSTELAVRVGPLASGPAVLADGEGIRQVLQQHRKLIGVDMEAYGVFMAACQATKHRPHALVAKSVVDHADTDKGDEYQHYGAYTAARVLAAVLMQAT